MAKKRIKKITWATIEKYRGYITKLVANKIIEINIKDKSITIDDAITECMIHIYEHRDRYDCKRAGAGTFFKIKVRQHLFKMYSKAKIMNRNDKMYREYKKGYINKETLK